ncbi:unnamed protein product [Bursaphelenchus okinawaensis]|uniref:Cyclin-like domain-containing protein n=1 Tax=Bursaphelenchus okinawaensis TaxID=465554 RepID=A0A811JUN7_9BILA|nr:unnamed protein product [Bursaphelenchus okinawaensis]CAG9084409.1 unnamed protein product [Bursaphelenchus okinawaensis]
MLSNISNMFRRSSQVPVGLEKKQVPTFVRSNGENEEKKKKIVKVPVYGGRNFFVNENEAHEMDAYLKSLEKKKQLNPDFLRGRSVEPRMREMLVDWLLSVCACSMQTSQEAWTLAVYLTDRAALYMEEVNSSNYQLVGVTCLYIALKYEEVVVPHINDMAYFGGRACTQERILEMEKIVLQSVMFDMSFCYPCHFLRKFRTFLQLPTDDVKTVYKYASCFVDCALIAYHSSQWLPSDQAVGAYYLACYVLELPFNDCLLTVSELNAEAVEKRAIGIASAVVRMCRTNKIKNVLQKYKSLDSSKIVESTESFLKDSKPSLSSTIC